MGLDVSLHTLAGTFADTFAGTPPLNQFIRRCHPHARKSAWRAVLSRMQLTHHATRRTSHGASRLVQVMSAWSVKTRRTPSRHRRDARVYGHTTTVMHNNEYTPLRPFCTVSRCNVIARVHCPLPRTRRCREQRPRYCGPSVKTKIRYM